MLGREASQLPVLDVRPPSTAATKFGRKVKIASARMPSMRRDQQRRGTPASSDRPSADPRTRSAAADPPPARCRNARSSSKVRSFCALRAHRRQRVALVRRESRAAPPSSGSASPLSATGASHAESFASLTAAGSSRPMPAASSMCWITGCSARVDVVRRALEAQRARRRRRAGSRSASTTRDLPIPASPASSAARPRLLRRRLPEPAAATPDRSSRPTSGVSAPASRGLEAAADEPRRNHPPGRDRRRRIP